MLSTPNRRFDFLSERWEILHGDRKQCRESMSEYSITCIDMYVDDTLISAMPGVSPGLGPGDGCGQVPDAM